MQDGLSTHAENRLVWAPDVFGSTAFLISGVLAYGVVTGPHLRPARRDHEWRAAAVNLAGCVFFAISAVASYVVPSSGSILDLAAANWTTVLGVGLLLRRRVDVVPTDRPLSASSHQQRPVTTLSRRGQHQPVQERDARGSGRHDLQDRGVPARQARQGRRVRADQAQALRRRRRDRQDVPRGGEVPAGAHRVPRDAVPLRGRHRRPPHGHRELRPDRGARGPGARVAQVGRCRTRRSRCSTSTSSLRTYRSRARWR